MRSDWTRVRDADISFPIILGKGTFMFSEDKKRNRYPIVIDGMHRLVKVMRSGKTEIQAVLTDTLPPPVVTGKGMKLGEIEYYLPNPEEAVKID